MALLKRYSRPRTELLDYALGGLRHDPRALTAALVALYAYHDFTEICEFIYECYRACVEEDLQAEIVYLRAKDVTVRDLETWLNMCQAVLHTLITGCSPSASTNW